jgi:hypothetical protein
VQRILSPDERSLRPVGCVEPCLNQRTPLKGPWRGAAHRPPGTGGIAPLEHSARRGVSSSSAALAPGGGDRIRPRPLIWLMFCQNVGLTHAGTHGRRGAWQAHRRKQEPAGKDLSSSAVGCLGVPSGHPLPLGRRALRNVGPHPTPLPKKSSGALSGCVGIGLGDRLGGERYGWGDLRAVSGGRMGEEETNTSVTSRLAGIQPCRDRPKISKRRSHVGSSGAYRFTQRGPFPLSRSPRALPWHSVRGCRERWVRG